MRKKKNLKNIILGSLAVILGVGLVSTVTAGALTEWTFSVNDPFKDIKIESQEVRYDGGVKTLDVVLPEGATYELNITNESGEVVTECKDIGVYNFVYKVTIDGNTKEFKATLTIFEDGLSKSNVVENGIKLKSLRVDALATGGATQTIGYTIVPENALPNLEVVVSFAPDDSSSMDTDTWKNGKNVSDYVVATLNSENKTISIQNVNNKAFASQILVTLKCVDNPDIFASLTVDYKNKNYDFLGLGGLEGFDKGIEYFAIRGDYQGSLAPNTIEFNKEIGLNLFIGNEANTTLSEDYIVNKIPEAMDIAANADSFGTIDFEIPKDGYTFYLEINEDIDTSTIDFSSGNLQYSVYESSVDWRHFIEDINHFMDFTSTAEGLLNVYLQRVLRDIGVLDRDLETVLNEDFIEACSKMEPIKNEYPLMSIPKEFITVHLGDWLTVPYNDFFDDSDNAFLDFYIDLTPQLQNVQLDNSNLVF